MKELLPCGLTYGCGFLLTNFVIIGFIKGPLQCYMCRKRPDTADARSLLLCSSNCGLQAFRLYSRVRPIVALTASCYCEPALAIRGPLVLRESPLVEIFFVKYRPS